MRLRRAVPGDGPALTWEDTAPTPVAPARVPAMGNWGSATRPHGTHA